eukprot:superscaffoldBa00001450_g10612
MDPDVPVTADVPAGGSCGKGKDGKVWVVLQKTEHPGRRQRQNVLTEAAGPTAHMKCNIEDALMAFLCVFDDGMLKHIRDCTVAEAHRHCGDSSWDLTDDKFALVSSTWNKFVQNSIACYEPGANITIDEQLFPTKAWCKFIQCRGNKPDKFGIKLWLAADVQTKYILNRAPFLGKEERRSTGQLVGESVVLRLAEPFLGKDILNQMARVHFVKGGTRRWPVAVFYNILNLAGINAYILFKECTSSKIAQR